MWTVKRKNFRGGINTMGTMDNILFGFLMIVVSVSVWFFIKYNNEDEDK